MNEIEQEPTESRDKQLSRLVKTLDRISSLAMFFTLGVVCIATTVPFLEFNHENIIQTPTAVNEAPTLSATEVEASIQAEILIIQTEASTSTPNVRATAEARTTQIAISELDIFIRIEEGDFYYTELITYELYNQCFFNYYCTSPYENIMALNFDSPARYISWENANIFCEFINAELPSMQQLNRILQESPFEHPFKEWVSERGAIYDTRTNTLEFVVTHGQTFEDVSFRCVRS
jgi:hypothetical protein